MCGIAGIVAGSEVADALARSIQNLEYRGYDSCGIAILDEGASIHARKNVGSVADAMKDELFSGLTGCVGIAHTRWATHGAVTPANAHPHLSADGRFALVHNGIISNHRKFRPKLTAAGYNFLSETDSEVIAALIETSYKTLEAKSASEAESIERNVEAAFVTTLRKLEGSYAVAMISSLAPGKIFAARSKSPLIIGFGQSASYVASDFNAFIDQTRSALVIDDNQYALVSPTRRLVKSIATSEPINGAPIEITWDHQAANKGGFPHYMLKEIYEQPDALRRAIEIDDALFRAIARLIVEKRNFYLTGVGTTFYIAQLGQYYFSKFAKLTPNAISSDEFKFLANVDADTFTLAISQSGETYDTIMALKEAKSKGATTGAILNVMGASIARLVDHLILQRSGPEISVASAKAALSQAFLLARISIEVGLLNRALPKRVYNRRRREMEKLPDLIETALNEVAGAIHSVARERSRVENWLFLGRGRYYPVAREAALKMKEISYLHAEGMPSGFLKHGALALVDDEFNSTLFIPTKEERELLKLTISSAEEIRARGGYLLAITADTPTRAERAIFSDLICAPKTAMFTAPLIEMVMAQLLAYYTATTLKREIDRPRSLAKSVTVE